MADKILSYIGFARKAGLAAVGTEAVRASVRGRKSRLVVLSRKSADSAKKRAHDTCAYYNVKIAYVSYSMAELGAAAGRPPAAMISIEDEGLAAAVLRHITDKGEL